MEIFQIRDACVLRSHYDVSITIVSWKDYDGLPIEYLYMRYDLFADQYLDKSTDNCYDIRLTLEC